MWCLFKNDAWWKIDGLDKKEDIKIGDSYTLLNCNNGYHFHRIQVSDEIKWFQNWEQAIKDTYSRRNHQGKCGWLSPGGVHFPCSFMEHEWVARALLNSSEISLEATGWVKINSDSSDEYMFFPASPLIKLTPEQINWLTANGFEIDEWDR